jgi:insertion element IS1 protein InsB
VAAQEQALALDGDVPPGTRQIVAFANGDHSEATCRALWERVPEAYRKCRSFSDFWKTSAAVLPEKTHRSVGKETAHMERWNNTLRQRVGCFVREPFPSPRKTGGMTE